RTSRISDVGLAQVPPCRVGGVSNRRLLNTILLPRFFHSKYTLGTSIAQQTRTQISVEKTGECADRTCVRRRGAPLSEVFSNTVRCSSRSATVLAIFRNNEVGTIHMETVL